MEVAVLHARVRLKSFNGTKTPPEGCKPQENYWLLIGEPAEVVAPVNERHRVLVKFDKPVASFGLHCHNAIHNSLFVLETDLEQDSF
jgi:hypothetical protein